MFGLGVALAARLRKAEGAAPLPWALVGAGMLAFVFAQVMQMGASNMIASLRAGGTLPTPRGESAYYWSYGLIAFFTAISLEPLRALVLHRYTPGYRSQRSAKIVGAGVAAAEGVLTGAIVLMMLVLALVFEGKTIESVEAMGLEGRAAVKVGLRVVAWWEASPGESLYATLGYVFRLVYHLGVTALVMTALRGRRGLLGAAVLLTFGLEFSRAYVSDPSRGVSPEVGLAVSAAWLVVGGALLAFTGRLAATDPTACDVLPEGASSAPTPSETKSESESA